MIHLKFILELEKFVHHLVYYARQANQNLSSTCMSTNAGGGDCKQPHCSFCRSRSSLHEIRMILERDYLPERRLSRLMRVWEHLLWSPIILPYCFQITGSTGFLYLLGKSYVTCHQQDCLNLTVHSESTPWTYQFGQIIQNALSKCALFISQ